MYQKYGGAHVVLGKDGPDLSTDEA